MAIKCRLKVLLAENDMTQKELAEKTGIRPMTISKMCRNEIIQVPIIAIDKICEVFNCNVSDVFQRIENKKISLKDIDNL